MTNKQLQKKIEKITAVCPADERCEDCKRHDNEISSLCKEYALGILPEERKLEDYRWNKDDPVLERKYPHQVTIFNQAIKQAKENIDER